MEKFNTKRKCEKCKQDDKMCTNFGIPGINNYWICKLCLTKMNPIELKILEDWIVDNA